MAKRQDIIKVEQVDFPNKGKGSYKGKLIEFKGGIPGQKLHMTIKPKSEHWKGTVEKVVEKSPWETEETCEVFGRCGGCAYQSIPYDKELALLQEQIQRLYGEAFPRFQEQKIPVHPSPSEKFYRNKMEYTFGDEVKGGPLHLGLHEKRRFFAILDTKGCTICPKDFSLIREAVQNFFHKKGTSHYHRIGKVGFLRYLLLREGGNTKEIQVNLFTSSQGELEEEEFVRLILSLSLEGKVVSILHTVYDGVGDKAGSDVEKLLYGTRYFTDTLHGIEFRITPYSFFQTNTKGAEQLYSMIQEFAGNLQDKIVYDLYSGTGTIAQILAKEAKEVVAVELVAEAVEAAKENAERNRISHIIFHTGDVLEYVGKLEQHPDLVIIDPPRDGIHPKAIHGIIDYAPTQFIYVSCNPVTQVRDLKIFQQRGYEILRLECIDMFPGTANVEAVALLGKRETL